MVAAIDLGTAIAEPGRKGPKVPGLSWLSLPDRRLVPIKKNFIVLQNTEGLGNIETIPVFQHL